MILEFENPTFKKGLNLTVRRGRKWYKQKADNVKIIGTICLPFTQITTGMLKWEHDKKCRTTLGLYIQLKRLYPDFKSSDEVTLVYFYLTD